MVALALALAVLAAPPGLDPDRADAPVSAPAELPRAEPSAETRTEPEPAEPSAVESALATAGERCEQSLRGRIEVCSARARATPEHAAEDDPGVLETRACMATLAADLGSLTLAELLRMDPNAPVLLAGTGQARALIDDAAVHHVDLVEALGAAALAPARELASLGDNVRSTTSATLRSLQRANAAFTGDSALVVRGGVSMGAYQAGYLYYHTEFLKHHSAEHRGRQQGFSVVSGSSAGAINALMAAIHSCRAPEPDFLSSAFFQVWVGVGFYIDEGLPSLLDAVDDPRAALSKAPLLAAQDRVEAIMREPTGWAETLPHCEVVVGLTTTRTTPRDLAIGVDAASQAHAPLELGPALAPRGGSGPGEGPTSGPARTDEAGDPARPGAAPELSAALQEERFGFTFEAWGGRDPERPLHIHNLRPRVSQAEAGFSSGTLAQLRGELYPFAGRDPYAPVTIEDVLTLTRASAAFPLAFAPESMDYGVQTIDGDYRLLEDVELIDGGVFDNHPFGFAASLRSWSREPPAVYASPGGLAAACEADSPALSLLPDSPTEYLFVEPTLVAYDAGEPHESKLELCGGRGNRECLLGTYAEFALGFLESSREASLLEDADDLPYLRVQKAGRSGDTIELPRRGLPISGEQLAHFLAFFEIDFRVFDFIVGLVDAERHLAAHPTWSAMDAPDLRVDGRVQCLRDYWAASDAGRLPALIEVVDGEVPALPASCRELYAQPSPELERASAGPDRLQGDNHNFVALLIASHDYMHWLGTPAHDATAEFDRFFSELERAEFRFIDLQRLARKRVWALRSTIDLDAQRARKLVRDLSEQAIVRLADRQPSWRGRWLVELGGKAAANLAVEYRHPTKVVGLGVAINGLELHAGVTPHLLRLGPTVLRFDFGVRAHRLLRRAVLNPHPDYVDLGLSPGETPTSEFSELSEPWRMSFDAYHRWTLSGPGFFGATAQPSHAAVIQTELGVGFGVSEGIVFTNDASAIHRALRYGPEVSFGLTFFQRILVSTWVSIWVDGCEDRGPACVHGEAYRDSNLDREAVSVGANLMWRWLPL
ncbi:patatin-like phospholipase family protein [Plesiocystis pacifica SIR-1]|uniref:Patatin-like phospholipase family protein n=1 Tax=Plesiocystis pacifica SIR-1 TaxID=391625 RepID=A6GH98_9BACT|nr:patatin-like phospholipase family protein [Plesiocystis pacifica]EDM74767.1 patatin-like phospholipase family protein [Plesiocystis pacifica SIR-1]